MPHLVQPSVRLGDAVLAVVQHLPHERAVRQREQLGVLWMIRVRREGQEREGKRSRSDRGRLFRWFATSRVASRRARSVERASKPRRTTFSVATHAAWPASSGLRPPMRVDRAAIVAARALSRLVFGRARPPDAVLVAFWRKRASEVSPNCRNLTRRAGSRVHRPSQVTKIHGLGRPPRR